MTGGPLDPIARVRPRRPITGMSAVLLPYTATGAVDWSTYGSLLERTVDTGLVPAVNMDTGYVNLLTPDERGQVLAFASRALAGQRFVAGAFVDDEPGAPFDLDAYHAAMAAVTEAGGLPIVFPSFGLTSRRGDELVDAFRSLGARGPFLAFELGPMFSPAGRVFELDEVRGIMGLERCVGMKHSSLRREPEWQRLALRDEIRPDFAVYTGNDLAIDMVMYGSDYLLGLSAFAPDQFARRDAAWAAGDPCFYERNDVLQHLGAFAFRDPVPAYKHSAAQFLHLRGWIPSDEPHPRAARRPDSDREILAALLARLEAVA